MHKHIVLTNQPHTPDFQTHKQTHKHTSSSHTAPFLSFLPVNLSPSFLFSLALTHLHFILFFLSSIHHPPLPSLPFHTCHTLFSPSTPPHSKCHLRERCMSEKRSQTTTGTHRAHRPARCHPQGRHPTLLPLPAPSLRQSYDTAS